MARLAMVGAETRELVTGRLEELGTISGTVIVDSTIVHGGTQSYKCSSGAGDASAYFDTPSAGLAVPYTLYYRVYVYFAAFPTLLSNIAIMFTNPLTGKILVNGSGVIMLWQENPNSQVGSNGPTLALNQWYCIEMRVTNRTGADDELEARVDGVTFAIGTGLSLDTDNNAGVMRLGWWTSPGADKDIYFDDFAVNSTAGSSQNSWCGPGKQVLLIPISDNARDTLWTGGVGGTSNLFDAVNNLPPIGTATETNLTQIEHAGGASGTTDRYDANMTTYATAGLKAGDKLLCARGVIVTGEDVGAGDKLLSFEGLSNPVIASTGNFNVISSGTNTPLGTYPTNWKFTRTGYVYDQAVTLGTSPVLRVVRPETASRVASVCFMGLFVEYEEGTPPELLGSGGGLIRQRGMHQLLAQ